ncbi:MAG TPA: hypothetical protein VGQ89_04125 [Candidatus Limnocylindrales bacterium]|nr:hypothetical protein [Candidatus Limnocylindrales bacterium]
MTEVDVAILHPEPGPGAGPLTLATAAARLDVAERHRHGFLEAGATRATVIARPADATSFGARLRDIVADLEEGGLIVLGSGAVPLATEADRRELVQVAGEDRPRALTNNRYSADVVAVARARSVLAGVPDLPGDNALPRWLAEHAGVPVDDRRGRTRLGIDIDGPLDLVLLGKRWRAWLSPADAARVRAIIDAIRAIVDDPGSELVVAGRVSAANLAWLEARTASRTRALIEERGLRTRRAGQRPAASVLGALLERDGPSSLGDHLERLGEAAVVDTRVLLAHRSGAEEGDWPDTEDRFASDLLQPSRVADQWLRELTASAVAARIPILLGGHTLVGPGLRLALGRRSARPS